MRELDVTDPQDRAILEAARAWGVAPSIFLGRVRVDGVPEWLEQDRQAALDLLGWESQLCPGCRQPVAETTDPVNEERYVVPHPLRCHRCTAIDQAHDRYQDMHSPGALLLPVELRGVGDDPALAGGA